MKASKEGNAVWKELEDFVLANSLEDAFSEFQIGEDRQLQKKLQALGFSQEVESMGQEGCYNDGGEISVTLRVGDYFFTREGYYSSWDESQWSDFQESKPVEVTTIRYLPIKC